MKEGLRAIYNKFKKGVIKTQNSQNPYSGVDGVIVKQVDVIQKTEIPDSKTIVPDHVRRYALGSVTIEGWGTYYKRPTGGWISSDGIFPPDSRLAPHLESELKKQKNSRVV